MLNFMVSYFYFIVVLIKFFIMNSRVLKATIKNASIAPQTGTPKRATYNGALKKGWGDPVRYQRKMRNELGN